MWINNELNFLMEKAQAQRLDNEKEYSEGRVDQADLYQNFNHVRRQ